MHIYINIELNDTEILLNIFKVNKLENTIVTFTLVIILFHWSTEPKRLKIECTLRFFFFFLNYAWLRMPFFPP